MIRTGLYGTPLGLMPYVDRIALAHIHVANSFTCQPVMGSGASQPANRAGRDRYGDMKSGFARMRNNAYPRISGSPLVSGAKTQPMRRRHRLDLRRAQYRQYTHVHFYTDWSRP